MFLKLGNTNLSAFPHSPNFPAKVSYSLSLMGYGEERGSHPTEKKQNWQKKRSLIILSSCCTDETPLQDWQTSETQANL